MAHDDNNTGPGDAPEDPWAGLDDDAAATGGESFEFPDFASLGGEPDATPQPAVPSPVESVAADDAEAAVGKSDAEQFAVPAFDALSLGAQDGVFTDDTSWASWSDASSESGSLESVDPPAGVDAASSDSGESPLAVFPPADAALRSEDSELPLDDEHELPPTGGAIDGDIGNDGDADALAHLEDALEADDDAGIVAFAQPESGPAAESSLLGMEDSLVVGETADEGGESLTEQSLLDGSAVQIGTGQSGILPFEDWSDSPEATEADAATAALDDENPFGVSAFDGDEAAAGVDDGLAGDALSGAAGVAAAGVAAAGVAAAGAQPKPKVRKVIKKRSGGGGLGAALSVLMGGVLAIPIVIGLLFWVFKKDPFKIAPSIPPSLAFLLPAEFQVAGQGSGGFARPAVRDETLVASRSLDDLVKSDGAETDGGLGKEARAATEESAAAAGDGGSSETELFAQSPGPIEPRASEPPPAPLDTSALDRALAAADEATSRFLAASEEDPSYKRLLKDWYTTVAKVGEEAVAVEQTAAESGAEFVAVSPATTRTIGRILGDDRSSDQFAKLSRMWLKSRGRTSDGVVMPAVLGSSRKVGAWWVSRVRVSDDPEVPEVAVLSRKQPEASEGDAVVVLGLVFEPGVVWAAACGRFEPVQAGPAADGPTAEGAAANDLFPLE